MSDAPSGSDSKIKALAIYTAATKLEREAGKLRRQHLHTSADILDEAARKLYADYDRVIGVKAPRVVARSNEVPF